MNEIEDLPAGEHNLLMKLSGGADSSIVYYALCDKFKDRDDVNIICITLDTDLKNNYIKSAKRIIEVVAELTGKRVYDNDRKGRVARSFAYKPRLWRARRLLQGVYSTSLRLGLSINNIPLVKHEKPMSRG